MFKATTTAAGLPIPPGNSTHKQPSTKRSLKNLFTAKRSRRPTANAASAAGLQAPDSLDLDFGCSGLYEDEVEVDDEEDVLLEIKAALPVAPLVQLQASNGNAGVSRLGGVAAGTTTMHWRQQRYRSNTVETQASSCPGQALDDDEHAARYASSSNSTTSETIITSYSPPSARSSASFSTLESSFYSTLSPSTSSSSSSSCDNSACTSAILTPSLSSSSCASFDHAHHRLSTAESAGHVLTWHPEETADQGHLRRKQEEQAAIEALEAYFAIQTHLKQTRRHKEDAHNGASVVVEARRVSEPTNVHHQHSRTDSGATLAAGPAPVSQGARRGSAPTLLGLRYKRSAGSLQALTRVVEAGSLRDSSYGQNTMPYSSTSSISSASSISSSAEIGQAHSTDDQVTLLPSPSASSVAYRSSSSAINAPVAIAVPTCTSRLPSLLPLPSSSLNGGSRRPHDFRRARSSTLGTPRPVAMYSPFPSPFSSSSVLSLATQEEEEAGQRPTSGGARAAATAAIVHNAAGLPVPASEKGVAAPLEMRSQAQTQIQRRQRSSSYFSTYYGKEYIGRAPAAPHSFGNANANANANVNGSATERSVSKLESIPPSPTLPVTVHYSQKSEKSFIDVQHSTVERPGGGLAAQQKQSRPCDVGVVQRGENFLDLQQSIGPSTS